MSMFLGCVVMIEFCKFKRGDEMGYFSNGSEGSAYESKYCENCIHWIADGEGETKGCPVWDVHMLYNYSNMNPVKGFLESFIPQSKDGLSNDKCKMFIQIKSEGQGEF